MGSVRTTDLLKLGLTADMLGSANLGPSVFWDFFSVILSKVVCLLQNLVSMMPQTT